MIREPEHPQYNKLLTAEAVGQDDAATKAVINPTSGLPVSSERVQQAQLFFEGPVTLKDGSEVLVETAMSLLKKRVNEKTSAEYSETCQIPVAKIESIAKEFTSHGRKAGIAFYTGVNSPDTTQFIFAMSMAVSYTHLTLPTIPLV